MVMRKLKVIIAEFFSLEGSLFTYSLSFSLLLALVPALIIMILFFNMTALPISILEKVVKLVFPVTDVASFLDFFNHKHFNVITIIPTLILSLWLASRSIYSLMLISAKKENIEVPKWAIRIRAIYLFLVVAASAVGVIYVYISYARVFPFIAPSILFIVLFILYRSTAFRKREYTFGIIGSIFASIGILIGIVMVKVIVFDNFISYQSLYGSLAAFAVLLVLVYVIASIIYFGYCLNFILSKHYNTDEKLPLKFEKYYNFCMKIDHRLTRHIRVGGKYENNNKENWN